MIEYLFFGRTTNKKKKVVLAGIEPATPGV